MLTNQELARIRYAEVLREASRRHAVLRQEPEVPIRRRTPLARRLLARVAASG